MKPILVVMAAGMGSRYGGLKQIDPVGPAGEIIIDYSLYDAWKAGFETAVCIIKKENEAAFREIMDRGAAKHMNILYAFQDMNDIPEGFSIPEGRVKPWGTGHAILAARDMIEGPFAVINADDYYGPHAFKIAYDYLVHAEDGEKYDYFMVSYLIENTVTENGSVARGVCSADADGNLTEINERLKIEKHGEIIEFTLDDGASWTKIEKGTPVSMNLFGFTYSMVKELKERFPADLERIGKVNPLKGEYLLPEIVGAINREGKASVKLLKTDDKWYGVTYKEDRPIVAAAMKEKTEQGLYPNPLWG